MFDHDEGKCSSDHIDSTIQKLTILTMKYSRTTLAMALLTTTMTRLSFSRGTSAFVHSPGFVAAAPHRGGSPGRRLFLFDKLFSTASGKLPVVADEDVMNQKAHGTSEKPVQKVSAYCDPPLAILAPTTMLTRFCQTYLL